METSDKLAAVARYVEAFDKGDLNLIRALYADDAQLEDPVGTESRQGIEAIIEFYRGAMSAGVKLRLTGPVRCAGNAVAFPFEVTLPGSRIEVIDVFEFNADGRVANMRAYWGPENMNP